jgi:hypothetical protein
MARFFILICILCLITVSLALPVDPDSSNDTPYVHVRSPTNPSSQIGRPQPLFPNPIPRKYENFANKALYYGFNTAKVGVAVGIFCLAVTVTERITRWIYRHVRGSIQYWKHEINDLKNGGMDSDQIGLEKDEFVNDVDGWASPVIEKRSRHVKWTTID